MPQRRDPWSVPPPTPTSPARRAPLTIADRVATFIVLLLLPALMIPLVMTAATTPELTLVSRGAVEPGARVSIAGDGFDVRSRGWLELDGARVARYTAGRSGAFEISFRMPKFLTPGSHTLEARSGGRSIATLVILSVALTVQSAPVGASAEPSPVTLPSPTASALEPSPTATPRATAAPTATPVPATPLPTPVPVVVTPAPAPPSAPAPVVTPAPVATPVPTAAPVAGAGPMVPGGRVLFLSPSGSDAAAGTASAPWRTLSAAAPRLRPGDTLYVRGGTYVGQGMQWTVSGTAAAPIWVKAYPGERPVFDGNASVGQFLWFRGGASHVVVDGLTVTRYAPRDSGVIIFTDGAHHIVMNAITASGNFGSSQNEHIFYPAATVSDITIRNSYIAGARGGAVHMYHSPGAQRVRVHNNTIRDSYWGVIADSGSSVEVYNNVFVNNTVNIYRTGGATVTAWGNSPNNVIQ